MKSYTDFAYIYDKLIDQDYDKWADHIEEIFERYGNGGKLILDLACGTGNITVRLAKRGYDMIALDMSPDMLSVACEKADGLPVRFICQNMTDFELYGTVDAIICTLDAVNYVTDLKKLKNMMLLVKNYLNPNGLFVFDISSQYKISEIIGNKSFINDFGEIFYTWENVYNPKSKICRYDLTFFIKNGGKYERIDEQQKQRAYSETQLNRIILAAGLTVISCCDGLSFDKPNSKSERLMFVCKNSC